MPFSTGQFFRRMLDIIAGLLAVIILAPLVAVLAVLIRLDSPADKYLSWQLERFQVIDSY